MSTDPFAGIASETTYSATERRRDLLADTKRAYAKVRKVAVQRPQGTVPRAAVMADLVNSEAALDLWLLVLALEPVLADDDPLPLSVWAELVGVETPLSESTVSRAFTTLERLKVIERRQHGRLTVVRPLKEDGSRAPYERPGSLPGADEGPGFFTIPHEYWNEGFADRLKVPGKLALLIGLAETTMDPSFEVATTRAPEWYGISERTLERGYLELSKAGLLLVREQTIRAKRSKTGGTVIYHRALAGPFSRDARKAAQDKAAADVLAALTKAKG